MINNLPEAMKDATAQCDCLQPGRHAGYEHKTKVTAEPDVATNLGAIEFPATVSAVHFIKLDLRRRQGEDDFAEFLLAERCRRHPDDFNDLNKLPKVTLEAKVASKDADGKRMLTVTLHNPSKDVALMAHMQLRREKSGERVLPVFYSDNYVSLVPNETRTITIEAAASDFNGENALVVFDGWNVTVAPAKFNGASVAPNLQADPANSPVTGLPFQTVGLR